MSAKIIELAGCHRREDTRNRHAHASSTTYKPYFKRHYQTRREAREYLSPRGFFSLPFGWANGRWRASIQIHQDEFVVIVDMPSAASGRSLWL